MRYARFLIFSFFHCPDRDRATRGFSLSAFSTTRTGTALRAFPCFPPFPLPGPGLRYARFLAFRLFHCPDRDCATRGFSLSAFSTARTGTALRAISHFPPFPLPGPGLRYARFLTFRFFHCPDRDCATRGSLFLPIKGINTPESPDDSYNL